MQLRVSRCAGVMSGGRYGNKHQWRQPEIDGINQCRYCFSVRQGENTVVVSQQLSFARRTDRRRVVRRPLAQWQMSSLANAGQRKSNAGFSGRGLRT